MDIVDHETLLGWLTRLQLTAIRDQLDSLLDEAAEKKLTHARGARVLGGSGAGEGFRAGKGPRTARAGSSPRVRRFVGRARRNGSRVP